MQHRRHLSRWRHRASLLLTVCLLPVLGLPACWRGESDSDRYRRLTGKESVQGIMICQPLPDRSLDALLTGELLPEGSDLDPEHLAPEIRSTLQAELAERGSATVYLAGNPDEAILVVPQSREHPAREIVVPAPLARGLFELFFFHGENERIQRKAVSPDAVLALLQDERSRRSIREMIELDEGDRHTEVGGLALVSGGSVRSKDVLGVRITTGDGPRWLTLIPVPGEGEELARSLAGAGTEEALRLLAEQPGPLPILEERRQVLLRELAKIEDPPRMEKRLALFLDHYLFMARHTYLLSPAQLHERVMRGGCDGIYLGLFHVHPPTNRPSMEDKLASAIQRNLVLVPFPEHIEVHYLFFGNLADEPRVARIPR